VRHATPPAEPFEKILDLIKEIPLQRNKNGQYQHDDIVLFITGMSRQFKGLYNPLQPGKGMAELLEAAPNALNPIEIESTSTAEASTITILKQAIVDPAKLSKKPV
jgi:hypothetical protein